MTCEVLKRRYLTILLAHKQKWNEWREHRYPRGKLQGLKINQLAEPFASGAIADLIVILDANYKAGTPQTGGGVAGSPSPELRMLPGVKPAISHRDSQVMHIAKVGIVSGTFAGEQGMQRMMKIIAPLRR